MSCVEKCMHFVSENSFCDVAPVLHNLLHSALSYPRVVLRKRHKSW